MMRVRGGAVVKVAGTVETRAPTGESRNNASHTTPLSAPTTPHRPSLHHPRRTTQVRWCLCALGIATRQRPQSRVCRAAMRVRWRWQQPRSGLSRTHVASPSFSESDNCAQEGCVGTLGGAITFSDYPSQMPLAASRRAESSPPGRLRQGRWGALSDLRAGPR